MTSLESNAVAIENRTSILRSATSSGVGGRHENSVEHQLATSSERMMRTQLDEVKKSKAKPQENAAGVLKHDQNFESAAHLRDKKSVGLEKAAVQEDLHTTMSGYKEEDPVEMSERNEVSAEETNADTMDEKTDTVADLTTIPKFMVELYDRFSVEKYSHPMANIVRSFTQTNITGNLTCLTF